MSKPTRPQAPLPPIRKTANPRSAEQMKTPQAPPPYRPQAAPKCMQTNSAASRHVTPGRVTAAPAVPPAYRSQPASKVLQERATAVRPPTGTTKRAPAAPPVYCPQRGLKVAQPKVTEPRRPAAPTRRAPVAPPPYRPQPPPPVLQRKEGNRPVANATKAGGTPAARLQVIQRVLRINGKQISPGEVGTKYFKGSDVADTLKTWAGDNVDDASRNFGSANAAESAAYGDLPVTPTKTSPDLTDPPTDQKEKKTKTRGKADVSKATMLERKEQKASKKEKEELIKNIDVTELQININFDINKTVKDYLLSVLGLIHDTFDNLGSEPLDSLATKLMHDIEQEWGSPTIKIEKDVITSEDRNSIHVSQVPIKIKRLKNLVYDKLLSMLSQHSTPKTILDILREYKDTFSETAQSHGMQGKGH